MSCRSRFLSRALGSAAFSATMLLAAPAFAGTAPADTDPSGGTETSTTTTTTAAAQPAPAPAAANQDDDGLTEITVTAQRREQNLMDVPITVSAVSAQTAAAAGANSTGDLPAIVSGVTLNRVTGAPLIFIRGVGTQNSQAGEEGGNPVYLDGFYNPALPSAIFAFNNIERIEVLKGPQGTLFGRNSMGGAINVITRDPSHEFAMEGSLGYGNFNTFDGRLYVTGGMGDDAAADLSLYYHNQMDGWGVNQFNGRDVNRLREFAGRVKVLLTPGDNTRIELAADYDKTNSNLGFSIHIAPGAFAGGSLQTYPGNYYDVNQDTQPIGFVRQWGLQARISHDFDWGRLVSMSGYRNVERTFSYDVDLTVNPVFAAFFPATTTGFTQEVQILSPESSRVQWIMGAFYLSSSAHQVQTSTGTSLAAIGGLRIQDATIDTDSIAGYAQVTVPLGRNSDITGGIRYTHDNKSLNFIQRQPNQGPAGTLQSRQDEDTWNALTWRVAASHHFSDQIMAYASVSRGFKSGMYNPTNLTNPVAQPEHVTAYELGMHSEFGRNLRFNASVFQYDYTNIQLLQAVAGLSGSFLVNAASAKVRGIDMELVARPVSNLTINAGATILIDHEYDSFPGAPGSRQNAPNVGGNTTFFFDASGNRMIQSPSFTGFVNVAYRIPMSAGGDVTLNGNYSYNSGYFGEVDNRLHQPAYGVTNASVAWTLPNNRFTFRVWARNLFDVQYSLYLKSSLVDGVAPAAPRTYGAAVDFRF